jgi:flagellar protein FlgJ
MTPPLAATRATNATNATNATLPGITASRPLAATPAAGGAFSATFRQVQSEVADFIVGGGNVTGTGTGTGSAPDAPQLSPEGLALRARAAGLGNGIIDPAAAPDAAQREQFLAGIQPWAEQAGEKLGVAPAIVAAHAALESGWGQRPLRTAAGADSNNLFGIKAGGGWSGAVTDAATTEYEHAAALKKVERFRSYPDQGAAFRDYASMLTSNPRYQQALNTGSDARAFAAGLVRGGYATDPGYADKLARLAGQLQAQSAD